MSLVRRSDGKVMFLRDVFLYGRFCNNLAELVLPDQGFIDTLRSLMLFAATFEMD